MTLAVVILIIGPLLQIQGPAIRTRHPHASLPLPSTLILGLPSRQHLTLPFLQTNVAFGVDQESGDVRVTGVPGSVNPGS